MASPSSSRLREHNIHDSQLALSVIYGSNGKSTMDEGWSRLWLQTTLIKISVNSRRCSFDPLGPSSRETCYLLHFDLGEWMNTIDTVFQNCLSVLTPSFRASLYCSKSKDRTAYPHTRGPTSIRALPPPLYLVIRLQGVSHFSRNAVFMSFEVTESSL